MSELTLEERRTVLGSELGEGLSPVDLATLLAAGYAQVVAAPRGQRLAGPEEEQRAFFLVLSGRLEVVRSRRDGSRAVMDIVGAGAPCGAVTAFARRPRWPAEVYAAVDARLLEIQTAELLVADPDPTRWRLLRNSTAMIAGRARHLNGRAELLSRRGLRERLAVFLVQRADAEGRVPLSMTRQELADFLVVSRASMTRELGRMTDEGLIALRGRGFAVLDREALADLV